MVVFSSIRATRGGTIMTVVTQVSCVLPGPRVEIVVPEFKDGGLVDVFIQPRTFANQAGQSLLAGLDSLPPGPRASAIWEEDEQRLRDEKEACC